MTVKELYFNDLCKMVGVDEGGDHRSYYLLAKTLHSIGFYALVERDDNRGRDAELNRRDFAKVYRLTDEEFEQIDRYPASVFEMLIALCMRMVGIVVEGYDHGFTTKVFFWELMRNLDLERFSDDSFDKFGGEFAVKTIVNQWLERRYSYDGKGGLFPLTFPNEDQRKVEIWYQMMAYLLEKYNLLNE